VSADPYRAAGVDVAAGERAVRLMRDSVAATYRPEVVGGLGGFAGLFALDVGRYRRPLLVASTDGVGTKVALARDLGVLHTVGLDLVAMVVDDLVVCGAEPLFLQDYLACGRLDPVRVADIVAGVAEGCRKVGAALLGGETAEHPGLMGVDDFDLAGTAVGVVEADAVLGADRVLPGDTLVALASSGLHSNGFSLVRQVLRDSGAKLEEPFPGGRTLGSALLEPTRIYALDCLALAAGIEVHAFAHVTGGGLAANLARVLPRGVRAVVDRATWALPTEVRWLSAASGRSPSDLEGSLNMGVGMLAVVPESAGGDAVALLAGRGVPSWICGSVTAAGAGTSGVELVGSHSSTAMA
jgi:phosphoribosylformylglycinamidine cyclo-ligase